jgi:preprotein translocase subunit YajC
MPNQIMESIPGIQIFGVVALVLFFILFLFLIIRTWRADKQYLKKMSSLPLEQSTTHGDESHE